MSEYKRLTKDEKEIIARIKADMAAGRDTVLSWGESHIPMNAILRRAELEDDIENGLRPKLPCRVGDTVWAVKERNDWYFVESVIVTGFEVRMDSIKILSEIPEFPICLCGTYLTKSQAEAKLKELKGEKQ